MRYPFYTADVFTDRPFGGNQLAVFPDAGELNTRQMQLVAQELNLSETVFVFPPSSPANTRRLRIFTPAAELPFAGHPTIGTAYILGSIGAIGCDDAITRIVFEEGVGPVAVTVHAERGHPTFAQLAAAKLPEVGPPPPAPELIAAVLSLELSDLLEGEAPQALSCGVPFLFVPLRDRAALRRARLDLARWQATLASYWAPHIYPFTYDAERPGSQVRARMFAPASGISEDPATGGAAVALAGYLGARDPARQATLRWVIEQGFEIGRPSILEIEADKHDGAIVATRVGGAAVLMSEGTIEIPALAE
jgi:trans-2,3-dihydro-3-hydroxyanthranilate isomerase